MNKEKVAVMFGGRSAEHEISVITALQAIQAIDPLRYEAIPVYLSLNGKWYTGDALLNRQFYKNLPHTLSQAEEVSLLPDPAVGGFTRLPNQQKIPVDLCLLAFHGQYGEDGCVQGLLELAGLPYTGSGVLSSALTMNKYQCKAVLQAHEISVLPSVLVTKTEAIDSLESARNKILKSLRYPLFIKPNHLGSSVGISMAKDERTLNAALAKVFQYDDTALVEPHIEQLLELNVAVLEGEPPIASVIEIPIASKEALSYEDKYMRGGSKTTGGQSSGMAGLTRIIDPVDIDPTLKDQLKSEAIKAFNLLECSGVCRLDFIYDLKEETLYFNELNPIPGSLAYYLWDKAEPPLLYTELLDRLLQSAKKRKAMHYSLRKNLGFHAL
ncbi:MAG: D-alanine--D-alanine ligase A [Chlamydiae bacterium]|nr:D-alanine--D-alanine ligase A [Chlamydiota bacterium]